MLLEFFNFKGRIDLVLLYELIADFNIIERLHASYILCHVTHVLIRKRINVVQYSTAIYSR
jgi:hypothetical protein